METTDAVVRRPLPPVPLPGSAQETRQAAAQQFVAGMRAAAVAFSAAGDALSAVVAEAVPPARHRRARCRVVLRHAGGAQADTTFLGPAGAPTLAAREWFAAEIRRWLAAGRQADAPWPAHDPAAGPGGQVVDVCAWAVAG
jgi:hypothetical protein